MKLVPSVAKAMRCPLGDISMDVTHCVNGAVRITWKEAYQEQMLPTEGKPRKAAYSKL